MNFAFSEEQEAFRAELRRCFEEHAPTAAVFRAMESADGFDRALWKRLAGELGLPGVHLPEAYGGQGFGFLELGIVLEEAGRVLFPSPLFSTVCLGRGCDPERRAARRRSARCCPGIASGDTLATLALLEPGGGWDLESIRLAVEMDGGGARLSGSKRFVTDAATADLIVVAARREATHGPRRRGPLRRAPRARPGSRVTPVEPLDATRKLAHLELARVAAEPLGEPGGAGAALARTLDQARVMLACESAGGAQHCLDSAVAWAKQRVQFARPIGSFQAIQHKCAEVLLEVASAQSAAHFASWAAAAGRGPSARRRDGKILLRRGLPARLAGEPPHPRRCRLHLGGRAPSLLQARQGQRDPARPARLSARAHRAGARLLATRADTRESTPRPAGLGIPHCGVRRSGRARLSERATRSERSDMPSGLASSDTRRRWLFLGGWMLAWAALAWWRWAREPYLLDDAFISFRYARNLVEGHGLVYNPGERVEGYTNFLWTLFVAGLLRMGIDPLTGTRILGVGAYVVSTAAVSGLVLREPLPRPTWKVVSLALAPLALILPAGYAGFAGTGMETSFVGLLGLGMAWRGFLEPPRTRRDRAIFAALTMALVATRLDCVPWVALAAGVTLWHPFARGPEAASLRARLLASLRLFAPAAALLAVLLIGRFWYYGDLLPNTYYAKVEGLQGLIIGWFYLKAYLAGSPQVFVCLGLMAAGLVLAKSGDVRRFILYALLCVGLHALVVVMVGGDFMHYRLMFHVYPLLVAAALVGLVVVDRKHALIGLVSSGALAIASLAPSVLDTRYHMESLEEMHRCCGLPGIAFGRRLKQVLPPDTVIATTMAGGIAYYSGLTTIDQLGLTDREVARNGVVAKPVRRGHVKRASSAYLASRGVNLVIHHPRVVRCSRPRTLGAGANVFIRMEGDVCLRTRYLTPTPELSRLFCSRPGVFVVRGFDCEAVLRSPEIKEPRDPGARAPSEQAPVADPRVACNARKPPRDSRLRWDPIRRGSPSPHSSSGCG